MSATPCKQIIGLSSIYAQIINYRIMLKNSFGLCYEGLCSRLKFVHFLGA